jgi:hypothetical protein
MKTISSLMDYERYMQVERDFLPQEDLDRRYKRADKEPTT